MDFISALREFVNESFDTAVTNPYLTYSAVLDKCSDSNEHSSVHMFYRIDSVMHIFAVLNQYGEDGAELLKTRYPEFIDTDAENSKSSRTDMYDEKISEKSYIHIIDICYDILSPGWLDVHPEDQIKEVCAKYMTNNALQPAAGVPGGINKFKQLVIYANGAKLYVHFEESLAAPRLSGGMFTPSYKCGIVSSEGDKEIVYVYSGMTERKVSLPSDCYDSVTIISPDELRYSEKKQSAVNSVNVVGCKKTAGLYTFASEISVEAESWIGLTLYGDHDTKVYAKGTEKETKLHFTLVSIDVYNADTVQGFMNSHPVSHKVDGMHMKTYSVYENGTTNKKRLDDYEEKTEPAKYFSTQTEDLCKKGGSNTVDINIENVVYLSIQ